MVVKKVGSGVRWSELKFYLQSIISCLCFPVYNREIVIVCTSKVYENWMRYHMYGASHGAWHKLSAQKNISYHSKFRVWHGLGSLRSRLRQNLVCWMFTRECPWDEHLWRGGKGSRMGVRGESHYNTGPIASANYMGKLWSENGPSKLHCVGLRSWSLYIPFISRWMCTTLPLTWHDLGQNDSLLLK